MINNISALQISFKATYLGTHKAVGEPPETTGKTIKAALGGQNYKCLVYEDGKGEPFAQHSPDCGVFAITGQDEYDIYQRAKKADLVGLFITSKCLPNKQNPLFK